MWHPHDHLSASLSGQLAADGGPQVGTQIHIQEAMQYQKYGWKYPVDAKLRIQYVDADGWAMGKMIPLFGPVMMLRIHFRDVYEGKTHLGTHYHYEVVLGARASNFMARQFNARLSAEFGPEFFAAWRRHNVIEVGTFENFLPALYAQKESRDSVTYACADDPAPKGEQQGYDRALFDRRVAGFSEASDPYEFQAYEKASFL